MGGWGPPRLLDDDDDDDDGEAAPPPRQMRSRLLAVLLALVCLAVAASASLTTTKSSLESCQKHSYMDKLDCKTANEASNTCSMSDKEEICHALQKMHVNENVDENVNSIDVNLNTDSRESAKGRHLVDKSHYKRIRKWKKIEENITTDTDESFILRLLSFNILAQELLETHSRLYLYHDPEALPWEKRKPLIVQEILESGAHIVCLQEMQEEHVKDFLISFQENGFTHLYKKRTNDKKDGLLLLYKENLFNLVEFSKLELYQTYGEVLNRDNVGLIAKFSVKDNPDIKFVIATTHLLYNPRRNDVRLGQVQLILAEIERIAFKENTPIGPQYLPIVLSGDFNLEPYSGVYRFITEGSIEFEGKGRNLEQCDNYGYNKCLTNSLIPPYLYVTDECQHFNVLSQRLSGKGSGKVMLRNTENLDVNSSSPEERSLVDSKTKTYQKVEVAEGHFVTFSSGLLTHPFQFKSTYQHINNEGQNEATTFQDRWITVDYIFYSNSRVVKPIEKYVLPSAEECTKYFPTIPNSFAGSDHLCLGATFQIKKR